MFTTFPFEALKASADEMTEPASLYSLYSQTLGSALKNWSKITFLSISLEELKGTEGTLHSEHPKHTGVPWI